MLRMKFSGIFVVICMVWKKILAERSTISLEKPARTDYFDGFVNYLKNESKLYRVVFILEDQFGNTDPMLNSLINKVNQNFPSLSSTYNETSTWSKRIYKENFEGKLHYRSSTLFVFQATNDGTMKSIIKHLKRINFRTILALPRCLIMNSFNLSHKYLNRTLYSFWKSKYLDVTIMTYNLKHQETPFLSHINPFTNTFTALEITPKIQWFPDKVNDLKGHKWNFEFSSFNADNNPEQDMWMDKRTTDIFATAMNSKVEQSLTYDFEPHLFSYMEVSLLSLYYPGVLRVQKIDVVKAVIPRTEKFTNGIEFSPELLHMIMVTIGTIVIILLSAFFMKFNRTTWNTSNISQIIIGMPANEEPSNCLERIVFGSLLITCIVYTGFIYSVILDIILQPAPEISNLEELADSSLIPITDMIPLPESGYSTSNPYFKKLLNRSGFITNAITLKGKSCLKDLIRYKNISCVLPNVEDKIREYSSSIEELDIKILPEIVTYRCFVWTASSNVPFSDFYNKIIQRATEFGLFDKVYSVDTVLPGKTSLPEEIKQDKLFFVLSYVLGIGYSTSIIVILFELLTRIFSNRMYNLYTKFRLES